MINQISVKLIFILLFIKVNLNWYLVDPAKEAHLGHRLSHASVSSGNETANSSLIRSEPIWRQPVMVLHG